MQAMYICFGVSRKKERSHYMLSIDPYSNTYNSAKQKSKCLFSCYNMLHIITLLILSMGYSPVWVKHAVGILLYTNMLSWQDGGDANWTETEKPKK